MSQIYPQWHDPASFVEINRRATSADVQAALSSDSPGLWELAVLLSEAADSQLETMAATAKKLTTSHFGRTISLYTPLYVSNYCSGGCTYCGFNSDVEQVRHRLSEKELDNEIKALKDRGFEDILLLTGERTKEAGFQYLLDCVRITAKRFHNISVESFSMTEDEYAQLVEAGCTGITVYQETYEPVYYKQVHPRGSKRDYGFRLEAPSRALKAGMRTVGLGALLGLSEPIAELLCLFQHITYLRKHYWKGGISVSFPRIRQEGIDFKVRYDVDEKFLAKIIFAFRICLPDVPLVLSTRERYQFRDGMAGLGVTRMSISSKTTVGGYDSDTEETEGQFCIQDTRNFDAFVQTLKNKGLEPVMKNWDIVFQDK